MNYIETVGSLADLKSLTTLYVLAVVALVVA